MIVIVNMEDVTLEGSLLPLTELTMEHLVLCEQVKSLVGNGPVIVVKGQDFVILQGGFVGPFALQSIGYFIGRVRKGNG